MNYCCCVFWLWQIALLLSLLNLNVGSGKRCPMLNSAGKSNAIQNCKVVLQYFLESLNNFQINNIFKKKQKSKITPSNYNSILKLAHIFKLKRHNHHMKYYPKKKIYRYIYLLLHRKTKEVRTHNTDTHCLSIPYFLHVLLLMKMIHWFLSFCKKIIIMMKLSH